VLHSPPCQVLLDCREPLANQWYVDHPQRLENNRPRRKSR
jgi:hypothetical protein